MLGLAVGLVMAAVGRARAFTVMAYNVENLVDADGKAVFEDYRPPNYSRQHVLTKVQNIARVLAQFEGGRGPDVIMFAEIEVDLTPAKAPLDYEAILHRYEGETIADMLGAKFDDEVADLPSEALLAKACADRGMRGYHVIAADNILLADEARLLAQKCVIFSRFPVKSVHVWPTTSARAILEVQVDVDGAPLYLFDNHWKSGAGDAAMERVRVKNARTLRTRLDEILKADPNADIIIGGDFNSQYNQSARYAKTMTKTGLNDVLGSQGDERAVRGPDRDLYNLWYELPAAQRGSDTYQGEWGTLMQLIISRGLFDFRGVQYVDGSFAVAKFKGLNMDAEGLPVRWNSAGPAGSGFSDHFPVVARFTTVADGTANRYLPVKAKTPEASEPVGVPVDKSRIDVEKLAVAIDQLPAGAVLRSPEFQGKIIHVEGRVGHGTRLTVEFRGEVYDLWSFDAQLRKKLRDAYHTGDAIRFYGELGVYKEHWQFVIRDESWVK